MTDCRVKHRQFTNSRAGSRCGHDVVQRGAGRLRRLRYGFFLNRPSDVGKTFDGNTDQVALNALIATFDSVLGSGFTDRFKPRDVFNGGEDVSL